MRRVKTILSLFDYSGSWSQPYHDNGYNVIQIDIKHGQNVFTLAIDELPVIHGVMAAPPCTDFASSGAQYWQQKDKDGRTFSSLAMIYQTLSIIWQLKERDSLEWWVLENPVGRLNTLVPVLADYGPTYFNPCDFGDPYIKKTGLWGEFIFPDPLWLGGDWSVEPTEGNSPIMKLGGKSERTKELRSITPPGFARAFYLANR